MNKVKFFGTLGIFSALALSLGIALKMENTANNKINSTNVSWLDNYPGYEDYLSGTEVEDTKTKSIVYFTDQECVDQIFGTHLKGRWVKREIYEVNANGTLGNLIKTKLEEWTPTTIERKTIKAIKPGERDPNEWCDSLVGFLNDYIKSPSGSYESFCNYINYLVNDFGMYEDEAEVFKYRWRFEHNSLTEEEKNKLEEDEQKRLEEEQKRQEALDKAIEEIIEIGNEASKNKLSLYQKEANMIERTLPIYMKFDREKYILLREKGASYNEAYNNSTEIDYTKALEYGEEMITSNEDWFKEKMEVVNSDSFQETLSNIEKKLSDFFKELTGNNPEENTEGESA